MLKNQILISM